MENFYLKLENNVFWVYIISKYMMKIKNDTFENNYHFDLQGNPLYSAPDGQICDQIKVSHDQKRKKCAFSPS